MNAILGTVQTIKAEQSLDSLKAMSAPEAKEFRNGDVIKVPSSEVTIGDIVMLEAGDYVPADGMYFGKCQLESRMKVRLQERVLELTRQRKKLAEKYLLVTEPIWCIQEVLFLMDVVPSW